MKKETFRKFDGLLNTNRLIFQMADAPRAPEGRDAVIPFEEAFPNDAEEAAEAAQKEGEKVYNLALQTARAMERNGQRDYAQELLTFQVAYEKLDNPDAQTAYLRKVAERIQERAQASFDRDGDYRAVIKAYGLKGVIKDAPPMEVVKAALSKVVPGYEGFGPDMEAQGKHVTEKIAAQFSGDLDAILKGTGKISEYAENLLQDPKRVAKKAALTRKYLTANHLDFKDAGLNLKNPDDFYDDEKLVIAVLQLQNDMRLPQNDTADGQDGILGKRTYAFALEQNKARESAIAQLKKFPQQAAKAYEQATAAATAKAERMIAQASADEVVAIFQDTFRDTPLFKGLVRVYQGTVDRNARETFLKQAADDLTQRLAGAPDMNAGLMKVVLGKYLNAIAESPLYKDEKRAEWVASAVDTAVNSNAWPESPEAYPPSAIASNK